MKQLRLLCLVWLFFVDVHVRAEEVTDGCWEKSLPCAVSAISGSRELRGKDLRLVLAKKSLLERRSQGLIELVIGDFYVEASTNVHLQTPYARVWCHGQCKGLFARDLFELDIKSLEGEWRLTRTGETQVYTVAAGLRLRVGEVTTEGTADMEFPQSLPWAPTARQWAALYPGTLGEFKQTLAKFRPVWQAAVESVSDLHAQTARRTIAAFENEQNQQRQRTLAKQREDESLRRLFREKNP